jgi:predicted TIM-barrel fold metal-dependent hydrolase
MLDNRYNEHHISAKMGDFTSHLPMQPSDYFRRNVCVGASTLVRREIDERETIGVESIMYGSDYPHPEGSWPQTGSIRSRLLEGVPEADIAAILGGNAARFYGLDVEALAPLVERIGPEQSAFE